MPKPCSFPGCDFSGGDIGLCSQHGGAPPLVRSRPGSALPSGGDTGACEHGGAPPLVRSRAGSGAGTALPCRHPGCTFCGGALGLCSQHGGAASSSLSVLEGEVRALGEAQPEAHFLQATEGRLAAAHPEEYRAFLRDLKVLLACNATRAQFEQELLALGYTVHPVEGDGNCLFHAVSLLHYGTPGHHAALRAAAVAFLRQRTELAQQEAQSRRQALEEYLAEQSKDRAHAGEPCLLALACILHCNAVVYFSVKGSPTPIPMLVGPQQEGRPLLPLSNYGGTSHFNPLRLLGAQPAPLTQFAQADLDAALARALEA